MRWEAQAFTQNFLCSIFTLRQGGEQREGTEVLLSWCHCHSLRPQLACRAGILCVFFRDCREPLRSSPLWLAQLQSRCRGSSQTLSLRPPELCGEKQSHIFLTFTCPQNSDVQDSNMARGEGLLRGCGLLTPKALVPERSLVWDTALYC